CSGSKWLAFPAPVRRISGLLAVDDIRGDRQHALRMRRVPIGRMLSDHSPETRDDIGGDLVDAVIVIAELRGRGIAFVLLVDNKTGLIARDADLSIFNGAEAV